jgi:hypothetical protein
MQSAKHIYIMYSVTMESGFAFQFTKFHFNVHFTDNA